MSIWGIADLHLAFGAPEKKMDVFGGRWIDYTDKINTHWHEAVKPDDLVLVPGDISWALHTEDALPDLEWIDKLPGTKVILRGNHDYWWNSLKKIEKILPPSIHLLQNNSFKWKNVSIAGARLWDTPEYSFQNLIEYIENPRAKQLTDIDHNKDEAEKIFLRELGRLELSLKSLPNDLSVRIAMTHYPPIGNDLQPSRVSKLLEKYKISQCVFGHLHNVKDRPTFGTSNGIRYILTSADYLDFKPALILE